MAIDMNSIIAKTKAYMNTDDGKRKVRNACDAKILGEGQTSNYGVQYTPEQAAAEFIHVLEYEMEGDKFDLGPTAKDAILTMYQTQAYSDGKGNYCVDLYFGGNLHRDSLDPKKYPRGADNIIALLNAGYGDGTQHAVHGTWHDNEAWSRPNRKAARFLEQTISDFSGNYGSDYGVIDIKLDDKYT